MTFYTKLIILTINNYVILKICNYIYQSGNTYYGNMKNSAVTYFLSSSPSLLSHLLQGAMLQLKHHGTCMLTFESAIMNF